MTLTDAEIGALELGPPRLGLFIRLAIDPVLRCWLGVGPIKPGVNALDADDEAYSGYGELINVPAFQQLINGAMDRVDLQLSGLDDRILALASFSEVVRAKPCDIGFGMFDEAWALLGAVHWCQHYIADFLAMKVTPAGDPGGQTLKTATLSCGSLMTGRRRPGRSYFNNQDQQARSLVLNPLLPLDRFCERTPQYSVGGNKSWPKYP
jgi:hypothetical protein